MDKVDIEKIVDEVMKRIPVSGAVHTPDNSCGPLLTRWKKPFRHLPPPRSFFRIRVWKNA